MLMRPIEREKVEEVVMQMEKGKFLGPDGFMVDFFQQCWDLVKEEVWEIVEESHGIGRVLKSFNSTFLYPDPKRTRGRLRRSVLPYIPLQRYLEDYHKSPSQ